MTTTKSYPKEMLLFLLQNTDLIESGTLTDAVEATVFAAIHDRIGKKLERRLWEAHYDLLNDDEASYEETLFCPLHWPKRKDETRQVYWCIAEHGEGNNYWLSSLLGLDGTQTCFELYVDGRLGGPKVNVKERIREFYAKTPALKEMGFVCTDEGELCLPFSFDAAKLASEFPDLRKPMLEFEKVFDKLLKATEEHIDKLILGMKPQSAAE